MALKTITGGSGSGKSYYLYEMLINESRNNPDVNYMLIVPEQFTMETQKDIVAMSPKNGVMNIDVLSFQRLAYRILDEAGHEECLVLEDTGKNLVLRKVIEENSKDLIIYGKNVKKPGFTSEMKSMISELLQYGISVSELDDILSVKTNKELLNAKLHDIRVIYNKFKEYISNKYITAEEILEVLIEVLPMSKIIRKSVVVLDGFTGFTPVQNKVIKILMQMAMDVCVTVTMAGTAVEGISSHDLFYLSSKTYKKLSDIAKESEVTEISPVILGGENGRFKNNRELDFLEKHIFRYGKDAYKEKVDNISITACKNPMEEVRFCAREIRNLISSGGYRFKDIAVVTGDVEAYSDFVRDCFKEYEIPCFLDNKRSIMGNPLVEFLRSSILLAETDFAYENVFRFIKTGLTCLENNEIFLIENYVLALGIRGRKRWNEKWIRNVRSKGKETFEIDTINDIRQKFMDFINPFLEVILNRTSTVKEIVTALFELMVKAEVQKKMNLYIKEFNEKNDIRRAKEYKTSLTEVIALFDKVVELLGEEVISLAEFAGILDSGFEEIKVGVIPPSVDCVVAGDIERTRLNHIKVLFFLGVNEGIIPKTGGGGGILNEFDRRQLLELGVELSPTKRESTFIDKFYLYLNMTKASDKLYITYSKVSSEGKSLRPSYLAGNVKKLFPEIQILDDDSEEWKLDIVTTREAALKYVIEGLNDEKIIQDSELFKELFRWYENSEEYNKVIEELLDAHFMAGGKEKLRQAAALALYGETLVNSVSRLEKYAACAFAHFLTYGLLLEKRKIYEIQAADMGTLYHETLLRYSVKLDKSDYDWVNISEEESARLIHESVLEVTNDYGNTILNSSHRNAYIVNRIEKVVSKTIWAVSKQLSHGEFTPEEYEVNFGYIDSDELKFTFEDSKAAMALTGRIDRIDTCKKPGKVYVKIVDYKTGNTTFDYVELYYGLQIQLVMYMNAALEMVKKKHPDSEAIPAGMLYYNIKNPLIDKEKIVGDEDNKMLDLEILKALKPNGIVGSEEEILLSLDGSKAKNSYVIPVSYNKNGEPDKHSKVVNQENFSRIREFAKGRIKEFGEEIVNGKVDINPYQMKNKTACDYCDYKGICGFDKKIPGFDFRRLKTFNDEEFFKLISKQEDDEDGKLD